MRKMASIRVIREIKPIESADAIEVAVETSVSRLYLTNIF